MAWSLTHRASGFVWARSSAAGWGTSGNWPSGPAALWVGGCGRGRVRTGRRKARSSLPGPHLLCAGSTPCPGRDSSGRSRASPGVLVISCFLRRPPDFVYKCVPPPPLPRCGRPQGRSLAGLPAERCSWCWIWCRRGWAQRRAAGHPRARVLLYQASRPLGPQHSQRVKPPRSLFRVLFLATGAGSTRSSVCFKDLPEGSSFVSRPRPTAPAGGCASPSPQPCAFVRRGPAAGYAGFCFQRREAIRGLCPPASCVLQLAARPDGPRPPQAAFLP